jgi:hypothetical protein
MSNSSTIRLAIGSVPKAGGAGEGVAIEAGAGPFPGFRRADRFRFHRVRQPEAAAACLLLGALLQPTVPQHADAPLQTGGPLGDVVFHQQVLGQGQQKAVGGRAEARLQQGFEPILLSPEAAQDQEPFRCLPSYPRQDRGVAGAHLQQQLVGGGPELALPHDAQEQRVFFVGMVLHHLGRRVGAVAGHHHRFVGVEQEWGGDVLARQGGQGDPVGPQHPEQVMGQGRGAVEIAVLGVDDQGDGGGHQLPHLPQQLQADRPEGLVKTEAGLVGADVIRGGLDHRLDPVAGLGEEGSGPHAPAARPALEHLRIRVQPRHQQRLTTGNGIGELDEEAHRGETNDVVLMVIMDQPASTGR